MFVSADTSAQQENGPAAAYGTRARFSNAEVLDFSSASEDEDPCAFRPKATYPNAGEKFGPSTGSATNMNLSALLMKHMTSGIQRSSESSEASQSDTDSKDLSLEEAKVAKGKTEWFLSSDSDEEKNEAPAISPHGSPVKMACDHVCMEDILHHHDTKAQQRDRDSTNKEQRMDWAELAVQRQRYTKEVESFDSSEDEAPVRRVKFKKSLRHPFSTQNSSTKSVQFTGLKCPTMHSRKPQIVERTGTGTIDTLLGTFVFLIKHSMNCMTEFEVISKWLHSILEFLEHAVILQYKRPFIFVLCFVLAGGLQEVSYTHSNQKVVGSSRVENRLSRAAVRDVFELSKHSQLPANYLHDMSQVFTVMTMKCYVRQYIFGFM